MSNHTKNSARIIEFLKANGPNIYFTPAEVANALEFDRIQTVSGTVTGLSKRGLAKWKKETRIIDGEEKEVSVFCLTEKGANYSF